MIIQNYKLINLEAKQYQIYSLRSSSSFVIIKNIGKSKVQVNIKGYGDIIEILPYYKFTFKNNSAYPISQLSLYSEGETTVAVSIDIELESINTQVSEGSYDDSELREKIKKLHNIKIAKSYYELIQLSVSSSGRLMADASFLLNYEGYANQNCYSIVTESPELILKVPAYSASKPQLIYNSELNSDKTYVQQLVTPCDMDYSHVGGLVDSNTINLLDIQPETEERSPAPPTELPPPPNVTITTPTGSVTIPPESTETPPENSDIPVQSYYDDKYKNYLEFRIINTKDLTLELSNNEKLAYGHTQINLQKGINILRLIPYNRLWYYRVDCLNTI